MCNLLRLRPPGAPCGALSDARPPVLDMAATVLVAGLLSLLGWLAGRLDAWIEVMPAPHGFGELARRAIANLEFGFPIEDPDGPDIALAEAAATAQHGQNPARVGIVAATDVHAEP